MTGLLLLVSETLVVVLTAVRRPAGDRGPHVARPGDRRGLDRRASRSSGPSARRSCRTCTRPSPRPSGLLVIITGKLTLGRSFGLMPAHRGLVCTGIYGWVRHPIYAGYLVTHVAFLVAHPAWWNVLLLVVSDLSLLIRAGYEERTLARRPGVRGLHGARAVAGSPRRVLNDSLPSREQPRSQRVQRLCSPG